MKIIGALMLVILFGGLFGYITRESGIRAAFMTFGIGIFIVAWIALAVYFLLR